jgi:methyl-accepting chemotaxis protein
MDTSKSGMDSNFLGAMGYSLAEVQGQHHRMFVDPAEANGAEYREFWAKLKRGEFQAAEFKRIAKGGREIWIEASYNPIFDRNGKPYKVVKFATDITEKKINAMDSAGKGGKEVWIQASYNPILDLNGKPYKVVKYASDITLQALTRMRAERARSLIESVAAGGEEMSASIREISETMVNSRRTASEAVEQVDAADVQAQRLTAAALSMEGITEMISSITGQINLLALNATIESARAGEAGRGFAVVASEVKGLANQAKSATDKISAEIASLGGISSDVVTALSAIKNSIEQINEFVTTTSAAVEEQSAVTEDMSSNMQKAVAELAG